LKRNRRGNHEGTIYQRADGRWMGMLSLPGGVRKSFYGRTSDEVRRQLVEAAHVNDQGANTDAKSLTVGQFLDMWLDRIAKPRVRAQTYKGYEVNVRVHLKPAIGKIELAKLQAADVQDLIDRKVREGLAPKSIRYMHGILRNALNRAIRWDYIQRNVAAHVDGPRIEQQEIQPFTREEAQRFLRAIKGDRLEALYTVALTMGLRQGEALGLRWTDVDLELGYIRVNRQLQRVHYKYELVEPKTARSRRHVAVPAAIIGALRAHKERQDSERDAARRRWHDTNLVFCRPDGYPLSGSVVTHRFQDLLAEAGLSRRRFHDLRHSCATLLLAQGVSPRVVMDVLGHSQISLTMNTYAHVLPELRRDAADRMSDLIQEL
jgi:integrase